MNNRIILNRKPLLPVPGRCIMDNRTIAERLVNYAQYLDAREANIYRMRAYRRAAETVMQLERPVEKIVEEQGRPGLESLPGIGSHLAYTIDQLVRTGEFRTLNPDGGRVDSEYLFASLPGVSLRLAHRIHEELRIDTLEQLEQAAHDGRLAGLGVGPKRLRGIVDALAGRLTRKRVPQPTAGEPSLAELLAVDQEYREQAALG